MKPSRRCRRHRLGTARELTRRMEAVDGFSPAPIAPAPVRIASRFSRCTRRAGAHHSTPPLHRAPVSGSRDQAQSLNPPGSTVVLGSIWQHSHRMAIIRPGDIRSFGYAADRKSQKRQFWIIAAASKKKTTARRRINGSFLQPTGGHSFGQVRTYTQPVSTTVRRLFVPFRPSSANIRRCRLTTGDNLLTPSRLGLGKHRTRCQRSENGVSGLVTRAPNRGGFPFGA